jgi:hypothetical protein
MTLCVAWVRQADSNDELVFATDSAMTGGEKWNSGIKLFELPRKDCLLCFAGSTFRACPLIVHLISSIRFNTELQDPHTDIVEVLEYLSDLFTGLVKGVISEIAGENIHDMRGERLLTAFRAHSYLKFIDDLKGAQTGADLQEEEV